VVNVKNAPGWKNKNVNPFWWASGIAEGVKKARNEEIHPVVYSPGSSLYTQIIRDVFDGFPVSHKKDDKRKNHESIMLARKAVDRGQVVLIAPEGENRIGLSKPHLGGISRLLSSRTMFVPVAFFELESGGDFSYKVIFGKPVTCDFDLPLPKNSSDSLPLDEDDRNRVDDFVDYLMIRIASLLPEDKRGVYTDKLK